MQEKHQSLKARGIAQQNLSVARVANIPYEVLKAGDGGDSRVNEREFLKVATAYAPNTVHQGYVTPERVHGVQSSPITDADAPQPTQTLKLTREDAAKLLGTDISNIVNFGDRYTTSEVISGLEIAAGIVSGVHKVVKTDKGDYAILKTPTEISYDAKRFVSESADKNSDGTVSPVEAKDYGTKVLLGAQAKADYEAQRKRELKETQEDLERDAREARKRIKNR